MHSERCKLRKIRIASIKYQPKLLKTEKNKTIPLKKHPTPSPIHHPHLPPFDPQNHTEPINQQEKSHLHLVCSPESNQTVTDQLKKIDSLIDQSCNVNATDIDGLSVLYYAVKNCNSEVVEKLVNRGATIGLFQMNKTRESPLHLAVKLRRLDMVNSLMKIIVDIDALDVNNLSSLHYALIQNDVDIVNSLINHGADMNLKESNFGFTVTHLAILSSTVLPYKKFNVNEIADEGMSLLHLALIESNVEAVKHLIEFGADVRKPECIFNFTPMHLTAFAGEDEVELLASIGCDVNGTTDKGITPLHSATMLGNVEVVRALIACGADVYRRDEILGSTALHWAAMTGQALSLKSLLGGETDVESRMRYYWNIKFKDSSEIDLEEMLVKNVPESEGLTTITLSPIGKVIEVLLECGPVADVVDNDGRLFLDLVLYSDNVEGLEYLLEFGVDVNDTKVIDKILKSNGQVKDVWMRHVIKLRAINMPVSKFYNVKSYKKFYYKCLNEVFKIKKHEIDYDVYLYDLLHMTSRRRTHFVEKVMRLDLKMKLDLMPRFPEYYGIIWASCREAVERPKLLDEAKVALGTLSDFDFPDLCVECVFCYLGIGQLKALIDAAKSVGKSFV